MLLAVGAGASCGWLTEAPMGWPRDHPGAEVATVEGEDEEVWAPRPRGGNRDNVAHAKRWPPRSQGSTSTSSSMGTPASGTARTAPCSASTGNVCTKEWVGKVLNEKGPGIIGLGGVLRDLLSYVEPPACTAMEMELAEGIAYHNLPGMSSLRSFADD